MVLELRLGQLFLDVDAVLVVGQNVNEDSALVNVLGNEGQGPAKHPEKAHEVQAMPQERGRVQGSAIMLPNIFFV